MPSHGQPLQGSQDRTHRQQQRQGRYERSFLKPNLTLPLTVVIISLGVATMFVEGTCPGTCSAHPQSDGQRIAEFIPCDSRPHRRLIRQGVNPQPRLNQSELGPNIKVWARGLNVGCCNHSATARPYLALQARRTKASLQREERKMKTRGARGSELPVVPALQTPFLDPASLPAHAC